MSSHAEQHTLYQVANAPLREHPFPHILVRDVFEPQLYRAMLEHLLPPEQMKPIKAVRNVGKKYSDERFVLTLADREIAELPEKYRAFWQPLAKWLLAPPFAATLLTKFGASIYSRFEGRPPAFFNEAMLVDDRARYSLGPHTDHPSKVITLLFYLPRDESRAHLGTSIYAPRDPAFRCAGGPHYGYELFDRIFTMPYVPNTLFAFVKTDNAFHGVEPIRDEDYRRHLLLYDIKHHVDAPRPAAAAPAAAGPKIEFSF